MNKDIQDEIMKEEKKEKITIRVKKTIKILFFLIIFLISFYSYTSYISTVKVEVREYRINNKKIPNSFNGIKIIQLSDLHFGTTMFLEDVNKIVKLTNERKPDIVVFTGDLIHKEYNLESKEQEKLINKLKSINASLGKYAILGDEDNESIATIFNQSNFTILRNEYELIYNQTNNPILLIGLSSSKKNIDIEKGYQYFKETNHNSNIFTITLLHEPDTVDDIIYQTDLFLAGHSHNGNIRIPFIKYSPFKVEGANKYDQDFYEKNNFKLYISSGLGTKEGIRLFCRPSINFFRLTNK